MFIEMDNTQVPFVYTLCVFYMLTYFLRLLTFWSRLLATEHINDGTFPRIQLARSLYRAFKPGKRGMDRYEIFNITLTNKEMDISE